MSTPSPTWLLGRNLQNPPCERLRPVVHPRGRRARLVRGYFTVDFALAYGAAILAMAAMAIYVERAVRGGFMASVRDLGGEQFDPRRPYHDNQQLGVPQEPMREFTRGVVVFSSPEAPLLGGTSQDSLVGPDSDGDELPSIPGGPVPREAAGAQTVTTSNWITTHDAEFNATR